MASLQSAVHTPRFWISTWMVLSSFVVLWDVAYCLGRPHTFSGGKWHTIFKPYALYQTIDYVYGLPAFDSKNGWTSAQASMNIVESIMNFTYVYLARQKAPESIVVGFASICMTISKTLLYMLIEFYSDFENIRHNDLRTLLVYWILPNGLWIVIPSIILVFFSKDMVRSLRYAAAHAKDIKTL